MKNALTHYISSLSDGYRAALSKLLNNPGAVLEEEFETPTFSSVSNASEYNEALRQIYANLTALFYETTNINSLDSKAERLMREELDRVRSAIEDLELRVNTTATLSTTNLTYTDSVVETFNKQTDTETDKLYYQGGDTPRALVDTADGMLKLPVNGEFLNVLSAAGTVPSNVFLDKVYGSLVGEGNEVNAAFDRTVTNFWCEVIHTNSPAYVTREAAPWIPVTYKGGAACRVRVDFEHTTQISEMDIRPYGPYPPTVLGVGYTNEQTNLLTDPAILSRWDNVASPTWTFSTRSYGTSGSASAEVTAGPEGQNVVHLYTTASSGACHVIHDMFPIGGQYGVEVSAVIKTVGDTALEFCMTFYTSGASGDVIHVIPLRDTIETVKVESLGWTKVAITFDPPPFTTHAKLRIGIPPIFERLAHLYISNPRVESINMIEMYQVLDKRSTVFLPWPINAKRAYIVFSQEHYDFKKYTLKREHTGLSWDRLLRRKYIDPMILSWDRKVRRGDTTEIFQVPTTKIFQNDEVMRPLTGAYRLILDDLEKIAAGEEVEITGYEYIIGAFEIYLRHREYAARGRFVTKPIKIGGEIREVALRAVDYEVVPGDIDYKITSTKDDSPESGKSLLNTAKYNQEVYSYAAPSSTIDYIPTDNNPWVSNTEKFVYTDTVTNLDRWLSREDVQDFLGIRKDELVCFNIKPACESGAYVQYAFSSAMDMRAVVSLNLKLLYSLLLDNNYLAGQSLNLNVSLLDASENVVVSKDIAPLSMVRTQIDWLIAPATTATIELTNTQIEKRGSIRYIRITIKSPIDSFMVYDNSITSATNIATLMLAGMSMRVISTAYRTVRFIPADEVSLLSYSTISDFIVPIKRMKEVVDGTDRHGRVPLKEYPYLNKTRLNDITTTLSANTSGRAVPFDPNAENPKYLSAANAISTTTGYRPILVTLHFRDTGIIARPDTLGKPDPGDIGVVTGEVLEISQVSQLQITSLEKVTQETAGTRTTGTQTTQNQQIPTYETNMKPIVADSQGVPVRCWWRLQSSPEVITEIDPVYIKVDAAKGLIRITAPPPDNTNIYQVECNYYYVMGEHSLREPFLYADSTTVPDANRQLTDMNVQSYPITRNMTDYVYGKIPVLRKPDLDPMSSTYYPVFEYYFHPDGYLIFADSFHKHADIPAEVEVDYDTMGVSPRLSIDFTRSQYTNLTPRVDNFTLLLNVRRG